MSDYLSRPVYDDIEDEARADWYAHRPHADLPSAAELADDDRGMVRQIGPDPWAPWTCQRCGSVDSGGMPATCDGCGMRNWGAA